MTRRGFLAAAAAFALDPERALWVPGAKTISVPAPRVLPVELRIWQTVEFHWTSDEWVETIPLAEFNRRFPVLAARSRETR